MGVIAMRWFAIIAIGVLGGVITVLCLEAWGPWGVIPGLVGGCGLGAVTGMALAGWRVI